MELGDIRDYSSKEINYDAKLMKLIPTRNKRFQKILDLIEIDLPTYEEAQFIKNISISLLFGHTDMASLTGGANNFYSFYINSGYRFDPRAFGHDTKGNICSFECSMSNRGSNMNIGIRPVLRFKKCPELWDEIMSTKAVVKVQIDNKIYSMIELGHFPKNVLNKYEQKEIDKALGSRDFKKEKNDGYTFDKVYVHGKNNGSKSFKPILYPMYSYEYKHLIHFKVHQNYQGDNLFEIVDKLLVPSLKAELSNGVEYKNGNDVWVQIGSIPWIVDYEHKTLIARDNILAGLRYEDIAFYLEYFLKYELLCHEGVISQHKVKIPIEEIKSYNSTKINEIMAILTQIKECKKYYLGDVDIESKVNELLDNYNKELDELSKNIGHETSELTINVKDPKVLYNKLVSNLNEILMEIKTHGEKVKSIYDMIDILEECKKDEIDASKDELCTIINTIKTVILGFITDEQSRNKLKDELNEIIEKSINRNKAYIEEFKNNDNSKQRSLEELKLEFRKDLHPFLDERLKTVVEKQDLVNDIIDNVNIMITNHFTESKNKIVKNYLRILNDIISAIKETGSIEDMETVKKQIKLDFNTDEDTNIIFRKLESMIVNAYKIELDIRERYDRNREIDNLRVHIDTSSIFNDNNQSK